jgi:hypothetical protein
VTPGPAGNGVPGGAVEDGVRDAGMRGGGEGAKGNRRSDSKTIKLLSEVE